MQKTKPIPPNELHNMLVCSRWACIIDSMHWLVYVILKPSLSHFTDLHMAMWGQNKLCLITNQWQQHADRTLSNTDMTAWRHNQNLTNDLHMPAWKHNNSCKLTYICSAGAVADPGGGGGQPPTPILYFSPSTFLPGALICWTTLPAWKSWIRPCGDRTFFYHWPANARLETEQTLFNDLHMPVWRQQSLSIDLHRLVWR